MDIEQNRLAFSLPPGIMLVDKPKGISSFDVIRRLRKKLGIQKMGHAGTLDPLASGLMIIGIGAGTKELSHLIKLPKVYRAEVLIGKRTESGDLEGKIIEQMSVELVSNESNDNKISAEKINSMLASMVGTIELPVPLYSAVKVRGQKLYEMARRGKKEIELPRRMMNIFWIKMEECRQQGDDIVTCIELEVSSGTYIRSIAEEVGKRLGFPATLQELRRTKIGAFTIDRAENV